jgi:hypothetical protein
VMNFPRRDIVEMIAALVHSCMTVPVPLLPRAARI